jgi:hypothetical protein
MVWLVGIIPSGAASTKRWVIGIGVFLAAFRFIVAIRGNRYKIGGVVKIFLDINYLRRINT